MLDHEKKTDRKQDQREYIRLRHDCGYNLKGSMRNIGIEISETTGGIFIGSIYALMFQDNQPGSINYGAVLVTCVRCFRMIDIDDCNPIEN